MCIRDRNKGVWKSTETCYDDEDATEQDDNDNINDKVVDDTKDVWEDIYFI